MALISDPRAFIVPLFQFKKSGEVTVDSSRGLNPERAFSCEISETQSTLAIEKLNAKAFNVQLNQKGYPLTLIARMEPGIPLFWRAELFMRQGARCGETVYNDLWQVRRTDQIIYLTFDENKRPLWLRARGCLINIVIYLLFFECDDGVGMEILRRLKGQEIRRVLAANWSELMSTVSVHLCTGQSPIILSIMQEYKAVDDIAAVLLPKRKGFLSKLFGGK